MISSEARTSLLILFIAAALACAPLALPSANPSGPTLAPNELGVVIAQTAAMAATQTAAVLPPTQTPTFTPSPTRTATSTPPPTATFLFLFSTATSLNTVPADSVNTGNKDFSCQVTNVFPSDDSVYPKDGLFIATWTVKNTGLSAWDSNNVDYRYVKGEQLHVKGSYDLNASVPSGDIVNLTANMKAPSTPGTYSTLWNLRSGQIYFCSMRIKIVVE